MEMMYFSIQHCAEQACHTVSLAFLFQLLMLIGCTQSLAEQKQRLGWNGIPNLQRFVPFPTLRSPKNTDTPNPTRSMLPLRGPSRDGGHHLPRLQGRGDGLGRQGREPGRQKGLCGMSQKPSTSKPPSPQPSSLPCEP